MFKKLLIVVCLLVISSNVFAYNPSSFHDEESISVTGKRPLVDVEVSVLTLNIQPEDFVNGIYETIIPILNNGNVPCSLTITLENIPVDLTVKADVDNYFLTRGETTNLNVYVELSDMQPSEDFSFNIVVEADLK